MSETLNDTEELQYPELLISAYGVMQHLRMYEKVYEGMLELQEVTDEQLVTMMFQKSRIKMVRAWLNARWIDINMKGGTVEERKFGKAMYGKTIATASTKLMNHLEFFYDRMLLKEKNWEAARPILGDMWYDIDAIDYFSMVSSENARTEMLKQLRRGTPDGRIYVV